MHKGLQGQEILQISSESKNVPPRESIAVVGPEAEVAQQPKVSEPADVGKVFQKRENEVFARKTVKGGKYQSNREPTLQFENSRSSWRHQRAE